MIGLFILKMKIIITKSKWNQLKLAEELAQSPQITPATKTTQTTPATEIQQPQPIKPIAKNPTEQTITPSNPTSQVIPQQNNNETPMLVQRALITQINELKQIGGNIGRVFFDNKIPLSKEAIQQIQTAAKYVMDMSKSLKPTI